VVPRGNASELHTLGWFLMTLLGIAFTLVGGVLVFGRSWTTLDRTQRQVIKQWGLLIPLRARIFTLDGYTAVTMRFVEGDSDSADRYPVLRIQERGIWRTRMTTSVDGSEILDVDFSSRESSIASTRRATEQEVLQKYPSAATTAGPRVERIVTALSRFVTGKGVTVKTRQGLTSFGRGLDDEEVRYLHAVVRRALIN
jgi:hypothetical protein